MGQSYELELQQKKAFGTEKCFGSSTPQAVAIFPDVTSFPLVADIFPECYSPSLVDFAAIL